MPTPDPMRDEPDLFRSAPVEKSMDRCPTCRRLPDAPLGETRCTDTVRTSSGPAPRPEALAQIVTFAGPSWALVEEWLERHVRRADLDVWLARIGAHYIVVARLTEAPQVASRLKQAENDLIMGAAQAFNSFGCLSESDDYGISNPVQNLVWKR